MKKFDGFERGMGIGGWLTNYKRFHVIPEDRINILTAGDEEHFREYITERDVAYIASLGFDHIRLCFDQIVMQTEQGQWREEHLKLVDDFIAWCRRHRLNVVLNLHKAFGNYCDVNTGVSLFESPRLQDGFIEFWRHLAQRYASEENICFELLNEVRDIPSEKWNTLAKKTVNAIRALSPARKIIIGPVCWNDVDKLSGLEVFSDPGVIYTFHFYKPFEFTHQQGVLQPNTAFYNRKMPYPGDIDRYRDYKKCVGDAADAYSHFAAMDKEYIYSALSPAKRFIDEHPDKILWCGEFGTIRHINLEWRISWFRDVISFFKQNDIPYSVWNYLSMPSDGNRFSLVDDDSRGILSEKLLNTLLGNF